MQLRLLYGVFEFKVPENICALQLIASACKQNGALNGIFSLHFHR